MASPSEAKLDLSSESEAGTRAIKFVFRCFGGPQKATKLYQVSNVLTEQ